MKKHKLIGITGPTGSGKTTVCSFLKNDDFCVIDADLLAREVVEPGKICLKELCFFFGSDILNSDGGLNRKLLAKKAFSSDESIKLLNNITHPHILARTLEIIKDNSDCNFIFIDAPLLFESNLSEICDYTVAVITPFEKRLERIINRDKISPKEAQNRMKAQQDNSFYTEKADFVIDGSLKLEDIKINLNQIICKISKVGF